MTFALPHTKPVFKHQPDATINQDNPDSGIKYEWSSDGTQANKLGTLKNVRIISIEVHCTWTVQPTPLEIWVTIDGQSLRFFVTDPESATLYYDELYPSEEYGYLVKANPHAPKRAFLLEGRSVKVEVEITGGTVSNLSARVKYAKIP